MEELSLVERESYRMLEGLEVIFYIPKILELEFREVDLKLFIGIYLSDSEYFPNVALAFVVY